MFDVGARIRNGSHVFGFFYLVDGGAPVNSGGVERFLDSILSFYKEVLSLKIYFYVLSVCMYVHMPLACQACIGQRTA